jgi:hypothetical protein
METVTFAGISVRMISRVLAQVVEDLCILQNGTGSLSQIQKFIELSLNESFGYMVRSKCCPKLIPSDDMIGRLHSMIMIPPDAGSATELLGYKERLVPSEHGADNKVNLDSMVRSQASASRGSSALWNSGGWVLRKS